MRDRIPIEQTNYIKRKRNAQRIALKMRGLKFSERTRVIMNNQHLLKLKTKNNGK